MKKITAKDAKAYEGGGPAFPLPWTDQPPITSGMSLRDYFAGQALIAYLPRYYQLNNATEVGWTKRCEDIVARSYELADAMLAERAKSE